MTACFGSLRAPNTGTSCSMSSAKTTAKGSLACLRVSRSTDKVGERLDVVERSLSVRNAHHAVEEADFAKSSAVIVAATEKRVSS